MYTMTMDAKKIKREVIIKPKKPPFLRSLGVQNMYERALRNVARQVGFLIKGYEPDNLIRVTDLKRALSRYSELIGPWALNLTKGVFTQINNQDARSWRQHSKEMSSALRKELEEIPVGDLLKELMLRDVSLIKSIPIEAAQRVHDLVMENLTQNARSVEIAKKILDTEKVTISRATLIARTEVARGNSVLTQARAEYVGSPGYIWRTMKDSLTRPSHKLMESKFVKWSDPPTLDKMVGHAGGFPNCRCYSEPVF